jgi:hypothetical protein
VRVLIRRSTCLLMLLLVASRVGAAQDLVTVSGSVTTRVDGMPVPGAVVSVVGADASTVTDANGRYTIQAPNRRGRGGRLQLKVDALAARGATPAAFDGRCIPPGGVAVRSNTDGILAHRALPVGRIDRLDATRGFHHGLLGLPSTFIDVAVDAATLTVDVYARIGRKF